jgi:nitrilase
MKNEDMAKDRITVGLAQIAPIWLNKEATIDKVAEYIKEAASKNCSLVTFGEAFIPGYPFWIELTDGAKFNSKIQKEIHSHYLKNAVSIANGDLNVLCETCKDNSIATIIGCIELGNDRGGHSIYCALVYINELGELKSVHRKLVPTYEERLSWSPGDGHGLRVHPVESFTVGGLNCWENWMPLSRTALYGMGEDLHVAIWPGGYHNTHDLTKFIAKESRSYVISVSGLFGKKDIGPDIPHAEFIKEQTKEVHANGGSCLVGPDGNWIIEPVLESEILLTAEIDHSKVREERHNFDPSGHYSRPDVTQLIVNRNRQNILDIKD